MSNRDIIICQDAGDLHRNAAARFVSLAQKAAQDAGRFAVALSGGSTPRGLYSLLATPAYREQIPWTQIHFFWGDERCVPPDHPDSNYRMAREALLSRVLIPAANIHRMEGEAEPSLAAARYETQLKKFFHLSEGSPPRFDLILLGVGEDGHTASLFPGSLALNEADRPVVATYVEKLKANRLTLTLPVLNQGVQILFLVAGKSKSAIVKEVLGAQSRSSILPAATVKPLHGRLTWLITRDASADLELQ